MALADVPTAPLESLVPAELLVEPVLLVVGVLAGGTTAGDVE